ncbi:MAG: cytochrome c [Proteobacteria bacterium]|nr:cytochrome c [Pseudomonadota bacterium]
MKAAVKPAVLILLFLLSGDCWAHGDKHPKQRPVEKRMPDQPHHWAAPPEEKDRINPILLSDESLFRGKRLYLKNCTDCHGAKADGRGADAKNMVPKPSNLAAMAGHHSDGDMAWKIKKGKGPMPGWEGMLSDEQIWNLVNYIQNLQAKD